MTRLVDSNLLYQQTLTRLNLGSVLLSANHACSGLLMIKIEEPQAAHARLSLVPCPDFSSDSGPDSGPLDSLPRSLTVCTVMYSCCMTIFEKCKLR